MQRSLVLQSDPADIVEDRALGALAGLAIGDALGMPTQMLPRDEVQRLFPVPSWFAAGPAQNRISAGWRAAKVTDDAEQALILATEQAVPAAFALVSRSPDDPWRAVLAAARLGGNSDTIAAIAGAIGGARTGARAFPPGALEVVEEVNDLGLRAVAHQLLALRTLALQGSAP